ncbi:HTH_Tnp_Tc3_2 domain-containing protein [Trichonephila clavipes]|nr:HTH_Tnp_Tc3_2 domain-containing protein [Trichonephila clavipes]
MPHRKIRAYYEQLSEFQRGRIIGMKEAGWANRRIAGHMGRSDTAIRRCWQEWVDRVRFQRHDGSAPDSSLSTTRRATRTRVSTMIIHKRIVEQSLQSYRPLHHLPLTSAHCQIRLQWCLTRSGWNHANWGRLVFSDESYFQLCPDDHRKRVWRHPGQQTDSAFTIARHTGPQTGVMVWGAIYFDGRTPLVVIRGTLRAQWCVDDILRTVLLPFLLQYPGLILQQHNSRPHSARVVVCLAGVPALSYSLSIIFLASYITRYLSNRACLGYDGKATASTWDC